MAFCDRAFIRRKLKDFEGSLKDYTSAIELCNSTIAYSGRGTLKIETGDYIGAIDDCTKLLHVHKDWYEAFKTRGTAKMILQKYNEAIVDFNKAIKLNPEYPEAYNNRGLAKIQLGRKKSGVLDIKKADELKLKVSH